MNFSHGICVHDWFSCKKEETYEATHSYEDDARIQVFLDFNLFLYELNERYYQ